MSLCAIILFMDKTCHLSTWYPPGAPNQVGAPRAHRSRSSSPRVCPLARFGQGLFRLFRGCALQSVRVKSTTPPGLLVHLSHVLSDWSGARFRFFFLAEPSFLSPSPTLPFCFARSFTLRPTTPHHANVDLLKETIPGRLARPSPSPASSSLRKPSPRPSSLREL